MTTNPITIAAPRRNADPIMVDMATSVTAEGKIRVAKNRGETVPEGWLVDHDVQSTTDPDDYLEHGGPSYRWEASPDIRDVASVLSLNCSVVRSVAKG